LQGCLIKIPTEEKKKGEQRNEDISGKKEKKREAMGERDDWGENPLAQCATATFSSVAGTEPRKAKISNNQHNESDLTKIRGGKKRSLGLGSVS